MGNGSARKIEAEHISLSRRTERSHWHWKRFGLSSSCASLGAVAVFVLLASSQDAAAQSLNGSGEMWGGAWQFRSPSARSVDNQQADIIKRARSGYYNSFGPAQTTVHNSTINDNRSNYVEATGSDGGAIDIVNRIGDEIGKVSNVTGAINTGSTEIIVEGAGNTVTAINSSDSQGCLDGSINHTEVQHRFVAPSSAASVLNTVAGYVVPSSISSSNAAGGSQSGCVAR